MVDDDIGNDHDELSELLNNPSREGLLTAVETLVSDLGPACRELDPARRDLGPACREPRPPVYWH